MSPDGTVRVIYDWNRQADKQILMATFAENDIRSKDWISHAARSKVHVNQAIAKNENL